MADLDDIADFVIVGTGAGGATAARVLSAAGHDVLLLEEGPSLRTADRPRELIDNMSQSFRDFATQTTSGTVPLPILQGRCVGGATAINSGIIWRTPDDVRRDWATRLGLSELVNDRVLDAAFEVIEADLAIVETRKDLLGGNGALMARAAEIMGLPGQAITRNSARCKASGECMHGCPNEARQSMDISYIPRALRDGARLHTGARVDDIEMEFGRAIGVRGVSLDPITRRRLGRLHITARRAVIVSASAIQTPVILRRSGFRGRVGEGFMAHPGCAVVGRFESPVGMRYGATQGYEVPLRERRMKLESLSMPPEMLAVRLPGAGLGWQKRCAELDHYAQWAVQVRMEARGRVRPALFGTGSEATVSYRPTDRDVATLHEGAVLLSRMMFAAGATEVFPGIAGFKSTVTDPSDIDSLAALKPKLSQFTMVASHLFATAGASADPRHGVVDQNLKVHGTEGLYVMDASVLPTNMGVNPQHTIMAVCHVAASRLANQHRASATV